MASFEFSLGTSAEDLTNIENLGGSDEIIPDWTYTESSNPVELANGHVRNLGFPLITWHWGFLSAGDQTLLKTYCPDKSVDVYVRTPIAEDDNGVYTYRTFQAVMVWPAGNDPSAGIYKDVTIEFRFPIEQPEESI
jgi:hypothetical protein